MKTGEGSPEHLQFNYGEGHVMGMVTKGATFCDWCCRGMVVAELVCRGTSHDLFLRDMFHKGDGRLLRLPPSVAGLSFWYEGGPERMIKYFAREGSFCRAIRITEKKGTGFDRKGEQHV